MAALNDHAPESLSSLSAMFDGEANEQDIDRILKEDSAHITKQLEGFHVIQQALTKESKVTVGLQDSFVSSIRAKIDAEDLANQNDADIKADNVLSFSEGAQHKPAWKVMFSSVAVAASVTFVVIFGGNLFLSSETSNVNTLAEVSTPEGDESVAALAELNKEALPADSIRLQHYLRQHAEQAAMTVGQGMIPMARVVSYPVEE